MGLSRSLTDDGFLFEAGQVFAWLANV